MTSTGGQEFEELYLGNLASWVCQYFSQMLKTDYVFCTYHVNNFVTDFKKYRMLT